jgi:hypothetical protein
MSDPDWLSQWSVRHATVLVEAATPTTRAALVDSNNDGRELWFGLDLRNASGEWERVVDLDDVGGHEPARRISGSDVVYAWGTGKPRERRSVEYEGFVVPVRVERNGWWLLVATIPAD